MGTIGLYPAELLDQRGTEVTEEKDLCASVVNLLHQTNESKRCHES
jgi:hypothetical protein